MMGRSSVAPRLRHTGGWLMRRWGLLPSGEPDGLGDDDRLRGQRLSFTVLVFFPDTLRNLYQLRQWYGPLRQLERRHSVGVVCMDSRTAQVVRNETDLPVVCFARIATLEELVSRSDVALALYVNHNIRNLHPLRFPTMLHAYLGHGESDKVSSASNQVKAYDFVLVAGAAGRDRLRDNLMNYDVDAHVRAVGRPQLDDPAVPGSAASAAVDQAHAGSRPTVLYAPTWEGAQPSMAYSSVLSHGQALLGSLLDSGEFRVIYRPHPRLGANRADYAAADRQLRRMVEQRRSTDPRAGHGVDLTPAWDVRRDAADLLVSDISAVAGDWMTTGKPLIVTVPSAAVDIPNGETVLSVAPGLRAIDAERTDELVRRELVGGDAARRRAWVRHAMGDVSAGASMTQFLSVCDELIEIRQHELASRADRLARGPA